MATISGYMVEADWDGATLRVRGTNKAAHVALRGQDHTDGDVVLTREQVAGATYKGANALVNGNLTVTATDGRRYVLHFRRKQTPQFEALARDLGALLPA